MIKRILLLLCTSGLMTGAVAQTVVYRNVVLIDGTGAAPRPGMAIVTEGERIHALVPVSQLSTPPGAKVQEMDGVFVAPGLIDAHVHYATNPRRAHAEAQLKHNLYGGVTAVRDMAGDARELASLARAALLHEIPAPDIYYAALVAGPSFFKDPRTLAAARGMQAGQVPWLYAVDENSDIALTVAQARGTGAAGLKIYANLPGTLVGKLVAEGKRQGFPVWTHQQVYPATPTDSLGATAISHACMVARFVREAGKSSYGHGGEPSYAGLTADDPAIRSYIAALAKSGSVLDATLSIYAPKSTPRCPIELAGAITAAAHKAGVRIAAGTDTDGHGDDPYPVLGRELERLVEYAGLTPHEAIIAATAHGAAAIGRSAEMGTLEVGKLANLAFFKKDPLQNIGNVRSVILTVKRGKQYARPQ